MNEQIKEDIRTLISKLEKINKSPYLDDSELFYFQSSVISKNALDTRYTHLGTVLSEIQIFEKNNKTAIVAGILIDPGKLYHFLDIQLDKKNYPIPTQISSDYKQVGMVIISENAAGQGVTRSVYEFLVHKFDIVSDRVQFIGAKRLWKSLAKNEVVNIYVFDGNKNDYIRNLSGNIVKYNGSNIEEDIIWGTSNEHQNILLVATVKNLE